MNTNMPTGTDNERAIMGDNVPDYAAEETKRLEKDYSQLPITVAELEAAEKELPAITDDESLGVHTALVKRARDVSGQADAYHEKEKEPHHRRGQANDTFFFGLMDRLKKRNNRALPGVLERTLKRIDDYQQRKLAEEDARRRRAAADALRKEEEAAAAKKKTEEEAREAREAAERARKPETVAEKEVVADVAEQRADDAHVEAQVATVKADEAIDATKATPADMVRTRTGGGIATMKRVAYAEITNIMELDKDLLWAFIKQDEIAAALRKWAQVTGHTKPMKGANIGHRNTSDVR